MSKHTSLAAVLLSLPLLVVACSSGGERAAAPEGGGRGGRGGRGGAVPVVTARAENVPVPVTLPAVGTVEAITTVQVRAQVTGQLIAIHFAEGQEVKQGQPLFSLDRRPFEATLQQAKAVLARDTATLQNAQSQQGRLENLFGRGLIPKDQYESQRANAAALAATVEADKAAVENAQLNLQYTDIKAPLTGRTGALGIHVGDLVRANDTTPLVVINQLTPVYVTFSVPGRYLGDIRRFQARKPLGVTAVTPAAAATGNAPPPVSPSSAGVGADAAAAATPPAGGSADAGGAARGTVSFIDNTVDPTTGTIRLKGTFPNARRELWPGSFVQVTLELAMQQNALVVPAVAVQASQEGQYVYVVKPDRTVEMRPVKVERQHGDRAVIAEGVVAGDVVVTEGHLRLVPGATVSERGETAGRGAEGEGRGARSGRGAEGRGPASEAKNGGAAGR
jgi:multidrug efflux system membrane fusion protein